MRAVVRGALGLMVVLAAVPAFAGQIGFLDAERAVLSVQEGKSQLKLLEEWATPRKNHIDELKGQVAALNEQIAAQQATLSAEALAQLQGQLVQTQRNLEDEVRTFNRELPARRDKMLNDLSAKLMTVAGEYAQANGFDAIFLLGARAVGYYSKTLDVTDAIIRLYDQKFPAS